MTHGPAIVALAVALLPLLLQRSPAPTMTDAERDEGLEVVAGCFMAACAAVTSG